MLPFIDLAAQQQRIRRELDAAMSRVLDHGQYIMGPEVAQLETELAAFAGSKHAIAVSDGTDALVVSLMALGIGPGDAILTTPFTFYATVEAIQLLGATPVLVDIDPVSFNLCPEQLRQTIDRFGGGSGLRLRGVIPVDLFGLPADYRSLGDIAAEHDLFVLQDAAQSFGAEYDQRRAPSHGRIGTTSFFPAKPLGCYGDGGAVFTDDDELAGIVRSIRVHGKGQDKYDNIRVGRNSRLDSLQAAILLEKLKIYPDEIQRRQQVAGWYREAIEAELGSGGAVTLPNVPDGSTSVWAQYTIRLPQRDVVSQKLKEAGIPSVVYYRQPAHLLGACADLGLGPGSFPHAEQAAGEVLSLPFGPYLDQPTVKRIAVALAQAVETATSDQESLTR